MRTARVIVGKESSKGATMMMSKASAVAERSRKAQNEDKLKETPIETFMEMIQEDDYPISPTIIDKVDKNIFIGSKLAAEEFIYLKNYGITHIINTTSTIPNYHVGKIRYFNLYLEDTEFEEIQNNFINAYDYIQGAIQENPHCRILIHGRDGISRPAALVIYYLMMSRKLDYTRAYEYLKTIRPCIQPNLGFEKQLLTLNI
jgi:protein-tyrosine phosphatase